MATAIVENYYAILHRELLRLGELPLEVNAIQLSRINTIAHAESGRGSIIQLKDISYGFDQYLAPLGFNWFTKSNGVWVLQPKSFERDIAFPEPDTCFFVERKETLMNQYLSGGVKETGNETRSIYDLHVAGAFAKFYDVDMGDMEFIASTGRTRTGTIPVRLSPTEKIMTTGIQIESDGALAFIKDGHPHFSPIEAKESSKKPLWYRQLFFPYWNDRIRHPGAEIMVTVVLRVEKTNMYNMYALKFENASPTSSIIVNSAKVTIG